MYSITDLQNQFSKQKINKAKKFSIREFEETEKNRFVCFVDDENESYDTGITLNSKSEITGYSCECGSKDFCLHVLAMGIFMSENKTDKTSSRKGARKKVSEAELAMENLNAEELKTWLLEFFRKNKEAEVEFMLSFGEKKKDFSDQEIAEIVSNTVNSVIGKKKNLTPQEVKKVVDLLAKAIEPLEQYLIQHTDKRESIRKFRVLYEEFVNFKIRVYFCSTRFNTFEQKLRERFTCHINSIKDIELWKGIAAENWHVFLKGEFSIPGYFYEFIKELYRSGDSQQKLYIAELVREQCEIWMKKGFRLQISLKEDLLKIIAENNFFAALREFFPVELYENSYNMKVIDEILKTDPDEAEKVCRHIIDFNSNEKYNIPYYHVLEKIYQERNNSADLAYIKRKKFWEEPTIANYIFIAENDKDSEEFKKFRNRILSLMKGSFYSYPENAQLYFAILDYEENYKKMLTVIDHNTPVAVINQYAEKLFLIDKNKFLNAVKSGNRWGSDEKDEQILADFLVSKYDAGHLEEVFSKKYYGFGTDTFAKMILAKIKN